jgi:hypothetical protein
MSEIRRVEVYEVNGRKFDNKGDAEQYQLCLVLLDIFKPIADPLEYQKYSTDVSIISLAHRLASRPAVAQKIIKILEEW